MTSSRSGRLPDFLLFGGMKCGSTSLHDHLVAHPQLGEPKYKEPGFFSRDERFAQGLDAYKALFAETQPGQLAFESSTCYSRWPHFGEVAPRIHEHLPDIKLVYIMRNPVERVYSHYRHAMLERAQDGGGPVVSLEAALAETDEYFDTGCYLRQIERFTEFYPRERFHFLTLDDLKRHPEQTLEKLQRFLEIEVVPDLSKKLSGASNQIRDRAVQRNATASTETLRHNPLVQLAKRFVPPEVRTRVRKLVRESSIMRRRAEARADRFTAAISDFTPSVRASLRERYAEPNAALGEFLHRALPESWDT